jgi:glycine/D-amino acid oxidase-like deaminating enzyme
MTRASRFINDGARIGILGGGASGLAAAHALRELGYRSITVFEREPEVGGKCCTLVHEGRSYELGAGLLTPAYRNVRALMREVGVHSQAHFGGVRAALRDEDTWRLPASLRQGGWMSAVRGGVALVVELLRREGLHRPGFAHLSDELAVPFDVWCRRRGCEALEPILEPWITGFGYGFLNELPAAYVLKYATIFGAPLSEIPDEGFGGLFRKVAAALHPVEVRLGARVTDVVRRPEGVTVQTTQETSEFDVIIVACPLDAALHFLDATPLEIELFERIRYENYFIVGASVSGALPRDRYTFFRTNFDRAKVGRPTFAYRRWRETDIVFFCGFAREDDWEACARREVGATVEQMGGRVRDVIAARNWRYFPHVQTDDIARGYYRRLEQLQGCRRTYYCGEVLAFAAVEPVVTYARALVRAHFSGTASRNGKPAFLPATRSP